MNIINQRSFSGGELTPSAQGRVDTSKYTTGARRIRNFIVERHGGAFNRPGTTFVGEVGDSSNNVRLFKFLRDSTTTFAIEFGHNYIRFVKNGSYVTETAKVITGITQANPGVVTSVAHGFSTGDHVVLNGIVGMTTLNGLQLKVGTTAANTFQLKNLDGTNYNTTALTAYASAGTASRIYTLTSTFTSSQLSRIQIAQFADVVTVTHPSNGPWELAHFGDANWSLDAITFGPKVTAPGIPVVTGATPWGGTGAQTTWRVSNVDPDTGEESFSKPSTAYITPTGSPATISWSGTGGSTSNIYRSVHDVHGLVGVSADGSFQDAGITPDFTAAIPRSVATWDGSEAPGVVTYFQQRRFFAASASLPQNVWATRSSVFNSYVRTAPSNDSNPVFFQLAGKEVHEIRHFLDLGKLICFTSGGEYSIVGGADGIIKPSAVNPQQHSAFGCSYLPPLEVGGNALFVQARGSVVRDLGFDFEIDGYRGNDLTTFSSHLFDGYTIVDWAYQQIPNSLVWAVRSDGTLISCTYVREQQMLAWHRHDLYGGFVESICCVPEGTEDAIYMVVKRTINGVTKRYIERMGSRVTSDVRDSIFMDCSLAYDGRNTSSTTMAISGGTTWAYDETMTLTASASFFTSSMVGNQIQVTDPVSGTVIRFTLNAYTSGTVMTGKPNRTVPPSLRGVATTVWARAVQTVAGLSHLEARPVSVLGDGFVVANPNNPAFTSQTVTSGSLTLDKPYAVIRVGLPITAELETLDIDTAQPPGALEKAKLVTSVVLRVEKSRGFWAGTEKPGGDLGLDSDFTRLTEEKIRNHEAYDLPVALLSDTVSLNFNGSWNNNGRVFIRQSDPLPLAILSISPEGMFPIGGQ